MKLTTGSYRILFIFIGVILTILAAVSYGRKYYSDQRLSATIMEELQKYNQSFSLWEFGSRYNVSVEKIAADGFLLLVQPTSRKNKGGHCKAGISGACSENQVYVFYMEIDPLQNDCLLYYFAPIFSSWRYSNASDAPEKILKELRHYQPRALQSWNIHKDDIAGLFENPSFSFDFCPARKNEPIVHDEKWQLGIAHLEKLLKNRFSPENRAYLYIDTRVGADVEKKWDEPGAWLDEKRIHGARIYVQDFSYKYPDVNAVLEITFSTGKQYIPFLGFCFCNEKFRTAENISDFLMPLYMTASKLKYGKSLFREITKHEFLCWEIVCDKSDIQLTRISK